jgi:alkylated DNA repair dioxygenase AlkB
MQQPQVNQAELDSLSLPQAEQVTYRDHNLLIQVTPTFLAEDEASQLYAAICAQAKFKNASNYTKKGVLSKKRNKTTYGCISHYKAEFRGVQVWEKVHNWNNFPIIKNLATKLTSITNQTYHVCTIQLYNNGEVGINPHRDKEMKHGTIITSVSLGAERIMRFERAYMNTHSQNTHSQNNKQIDVALKHGSLCLICPPTNDTWLHSIPKDNSKTPRISLVFRNCENM